MHRSALLASLLLVARAAASIAQPAGPEFRVNTFTSLAQDESSVSFGGDGTFVIVWTSGAGLSSAGQDGSLYGVYGQRYAANGGPLGPEFRVNTTTTNNQAYPGVAADQNGNFVVAWTSIQDSPASPSHGVYAQRFAANGTPRGDEFRVNTYTTGDQAGPWVASDAAGDFVVVWISQDQDGNGKGVFGQRYDASGSPRGGEFQVNSETLGDEQFASVSSDPQGNFVVVWTIGSFVPMGAGQRYSASGAPLGGEFPIPGSYPNVAVDGAGDFVVVWQQGSPFLDVFGQRYASDGTPLGSEFPVNTYTNYDQLYPKVAVDQAGDFMVVWQSPQDAQPDGASLGVYAQRYAASGAPIGTEFRVNTYTTQDQAFPRIGSSANGAVVVTWASVGEDETLYSVYGQRYSFVPGDVNGDETVSVQDVFYLINALFAGGPPPVGPTDANGDGVIDVRDVFYLINYLFAGGPAPKT